MYKIPSLVDPQGTHGGPSIAWFLSHYRSPQVLCWVLSWWVPKIYHRPTCISLLSSSNSSDLSLSETVNIWLHAGFYEDHLSLSRWGPRCRRTKISCMLPSCCCHWVDWRKSTQEVHQAPLQNELFISSSSTNEWVFLHSLLWFYSSATPMPLRVATCQLFKHIIEFIVIHTSYLPLMNVFSPFQRESLL